MSTSFKSAFDGDDDPKRREREAELALADKIEAELTGRRRAYRLYKREGGLDGDQ